jgi:hypothetical protein
VDNYFVLSGCFQFWVKMPHKLPLYQGKKGITLQGQKSGLEINRRFFSAAASLSPYLQVV